MLVVKCVIGSFQFAYQRLQAALLSHSMRQELSSMARPKKTDVSSSHISYLFSSLCRVSSLWHSLVVTRIESIFSVRYAHSCKVKER